MSQQRDAIQRQIDSVPQWYHRIPIRPGMVTPGVNDCATTLTRLGLPEDCRGMRALDLGTCDGFFAFELERRGAQVLAVDYLPRDSRGFDVAARLVGYQGEYLQENIYNLNPAQIGTFDLVLFLGLLYHLPDPLRALGIVRSLCTQLMFLETYAIDNAIQLADGQVVTLESLNPLLCDVPLMKFMPGSSLNNDPTNYWGPNMRCLDLILQESMFTVLHQQLYGNRAIVACRTTYDPKLDRYNQIARGDLAVAVRKREQG